ncbi:MAG: flagellar basal-body MS-ring/collar protein FliF [Verrucomicrobiota bacterium]|jgi:flagellar M-ring protein FliF
MNKNLTQLLQQLAGIWKQLGVNQRISITITSLAVLAGLAGVAIWSSRTEFSLLYGKLDQEESSKVIAALDEAKVPYQIGGGGDTIMVPADKVYQMRMQLAGKGIPRGEGVGFEIFDKANFGISDFMQRANWLRAMEGELARTVSQLDQVESARVMIVTPENQLLSDAQRKPTASVFVRVKGNAQLPASAVNSIRFLVANSVEGLQANNVSVVDNQGNVLSANEENDSVAGLSNDQLTARSKFEQYLSKKAEGMLEKVLGPGQAVVRVSAELNWDTTTRTEEKYDPDGQVARTMTDNVEDTDSATVTAGGAPGMGVNSSANGDNTNSPTAPPVNTSHTTKKVTSNNYEINKTTSNIVQAAGGLKRLSAAVFVAQKYEGQGADRKAVPPSTDEVKKFTDIVRSALGMQETDQITLEVMPFNDQIPAEMTQQFDKQMKFQSWLDLAQKMIYPALALVVLFAFWRMFQRAKAEEIRLGAPLGGGNGRSHFGNGGAPGKGMVTVEVLNQLIRENPANMTQAVRGWLGRSKN